MTTTESIQGRIKSFKASSSFTPGDPHSFSVSFNEELELPGKYSPAEYVQQFGHELLLGEQNVLVICPGNGGLCVEAVKAGASTVVALEPRVVYDKALNTISEITSDVIGTTFSHRNYGSKIVEKFDVIFWTEGLDEVQHPKGLFELAINSLTPRGILILEVTHGHHGALPDSINSWRPSEEAFKETIGRYGTVDVRTELQGRAQNRKIYFIRGNETRIEKFIEPVAEEVNDLDQQATEAIERAATTEDHKEKVEALDEALAAEKEKTEVLKEAGLTPKSSVATVAEKIKQVMGEEPELTPGELDSLYEGRQSTPKSKKKRKRSKRKS